jgi:hypothetical protein
MLLRRFIGASSLSTLCETCVNGATICLKNEEISCHFLFEKPTQKDMKIRGSAVVHCEHNYAEIDTTVQYWYGSTATSVLIRHGHRIIYVGEWVCLKNLQE